MIIKYVVETENKGFYSFEHSIKYHDLKKENSFIGTKMIIKIDGVMYFVNDIRIIHAREAYLWLSRYVKPVK